MRCGRLGPLSKRLEAGFVRVGDKDCMVNHDAEVGVENSSRRRLNSCFVSSTRRLLIVNGLNLRPLRQLQL